MTGIDTAAATAATTKASSSLLLLLIFAASCESFQFRWGGGSSQRRHPLRAGGDVMSSRTSDVVVGRGERPSSSSSWGLFAAEIETFEDDTDDSVRASGRRTVRPPPSRAPGGDGGGGIGPMTRKASSSTANSDLATVGDFDSDLDAEIRGALRSAEIDLASSGGGIVSTGDEIPGGDTRPAGEYDSIDVGAMTSSSSSSSSSSSFVDGDDDEDAAALLIEAQREADEAENMLRQAEEEASRWERELAYLEREEEIANAMSAANAERESLSSMADAYRLALDAANDNVEILSSQIAVLEGELEDAMTKMERSVEERERIGAEYAYLAKNYGDLKRRYDEEEGGGGGGGSGADVDATNAATAREGIIDMLNEEIESYKSRISDAETRLDDMSTSLSEAKGDAERWRNMHDEALSRMETASKAREVEHAEEMRMERESHESRVVEANAYHEGERTRLMTESNANIDALREEFEKSIEDNAKMISALRDALRKTRKGGRMKAIEDGSSASAAGVDDARTRMNEEVANLKSVLESVRGEMDEKEREVRRAMEGREETEKLMEEIRVLRTSYENERTKSAKDSAEYEDRLSGYVDAENAFKRQLDEKEGLIASLTREMDAATKQVEALKQELKALEGKVQDAQSSEASYAALVQGFADEKSAMEIRIAETEEKIASLHEELNAKRDAVSSAEKALDETSKALDAARTQYLEKAESAKKLEEELRTMAAQLADAEASRLKSESQGKEASTKKIQSLQSQVKDLTSSLSAANDDASESKQKLVDYEAKIVSMQENLMKSSSDLKLQLEEKEGTIMRLTQEKEASVKQVDALKREMEALESKINGARSLEASNASLMKELSDERSAMESLKAHTEQKIASLEEGLKEQRDAVISTEKALEEARTALESVRTQYVGEAASVKKLGDELQTVKAKLADAEASQQKSSQERDVSAKQIRLLQSQASSLAMQVKEANDKARRSEQKLIDYEAKIESMQGTLKQSSTNVLARANELAATKEEASLAIAEQTKINERMRSELDRLRKEMSASLAEANVEITQRGAVLEKKERMLSELQDKYDSVLDQMERMNASTKEKIELQAEQFRTMEASTSEDKNALAAQISQLREEISLVKSNSQKTITALNDEIKGMTQEIKQERMLRDEVMKTKSGLEQSLMLAVQNAEKATRDTSLELEKMSRHIEMSNAAAADEAEKSKQLLLDLKRMNDSLNKADAQIKDRDDALRVKDSVLSELQKENQSLLGEIKKVQVISQKDISSKSAEINSLKDIVATLTANVDKEIKLRQDVLTGKMTAESLLQKKLDEVTKAMENIRADAQRTVDDQSLKLRNLENSASKEKRALASEISQLKKDMSIFQANAQKAIDVRTNEIKNLEQVIADLKGTIAEEKKLKEVAMQGKSELEKALQIRIDELSEGISIAQKTAAASVREKNIELDRLDARIKELTKAVDSEVALKMQATKERNDVDFHLRARIAELEKKLVDDRAESQSILNLRDTLLSSMKVDFKRLSEAKVEVQRDRDAVEKDLTTKIFELKNKMSAIQMNSDRTIKSKSGEVDSLKSRILEEAKSKDRLIQEKSDELARMEKDLRAESELVAQLSKNVGVARADAVEAIAAKKEVLAELEQLRNGEKSSQIALLKLESELEMKQSATEARELANQTADTLAGAAAESKALPAKQVTGGELKTKLTSEASTSKQQLKAQQSKQDNIPEKSKAKGFGKTAMAKPMTKATFSPQVISLADDIAAEETQQVVDNRITEPPDIIVDRIDVAVRKLQARKETSMSIPPTFASPAEAGGRRNALRQLVTPQGRGNVFVRRNTAEGPSSITNERRSIRKNPLADLLVAKGEQNQASFPRRKAVPAPSSQLSPPRQGSPSTPKRTVSSPSSQGDTRKHGSAPVPKRVTPLAPSSQGTSGTQSVPSFPKREPPLAPSSQGTSGTQSVPSLPKKEKTVSRPSSQASVPRQGAPAPQVNSPANIILGVSTKKSPLTSLALDSSVTEALPRRKTFPVASSQATSRPLNEKKRLSLSDRVRARPVSISAQPKEENESVAARKRSLKDLIPSMGKPIGSYGDKQTTTKLGGMASPEQKSNTEESSGSIYYSVKKRSLKDILPSKGTLGSYGNKKTTTKLGGIASPEQAASTLKVEKQKAMKDVVIESVTANVPALKEASKSKSTTPSYSSLSAMILSQNPRQISLLHGRYKNQNTQVKLRTTVKAAFREAESPSKQLSLEIAAENFAFTDNDSMDNVAVSMKIQEAFQRALLSARIANDAKAKVFKSLPKYLNASLSQVVPSQTRPTLSQQKAFANSNRRTSLFPEKFVSRLSRLLQK